MTDSLAQLIERLEAFGEPFDVDAYGAAANELEAALYGETTCQTIRWGRCMKALRSLDAALALVEERGENPSAIMREADALCSARIEPTDSWREHIARFVVIALLKSIQHKEQSND